MTLLPLLLVSLRQPNLNMFGQKKADAATWRRHDWTRESRRAIDAGHYTLCRWKVECGRMVVPEERHSQLSTEPR